MSNSHRIAYITRHVYPDQTAAAGQSIQMAAAFARVAGKAEFYVHENRVPEASLRAQYPGVADSQLQIRDLRMTRLPKRLLYRHSMSRFIGYNSLVALNLLGRNARSGRSTTLNILFVRSRLEAVYWGLIRPYLHCLRNWIFVYEAHDASVITPIEPLEMGLLTTRKGVLERRRQQGLQALGNFDIVLSVNQALSNYLRDVGNGTLAPHLVRHASSLPRVSHPSDIHPWSDGILLGYTGTVDLFRGVNKLLEAMRFLPDNYKLRLVGRVSGRSETGHGPQWLDELLRDPKIGPKVEIVPPVPVAQVADEIDQCDIMLQPAGSYTHTTDYAAPLKLFDYMVRSKPIVAADVPCHREIVQDGFNASLYRNDDVTHLAACVKSLVANPKYAAAIARRTWEHSADYSYDGRAERILGLVDEFWQKK